MKFNIKTFYVLPTECISLLHVDLRTNSDYFAVRLLTVQREREREREKEGGGCSEWR
jgi:hypothetical protein